MTRTPGSNTVAYYPFDTNFNDYSGNNRNLTNSGFSISTYDGVKCAYQNSTDSYYMYNSSQPLTGNASFTVSVRAKSVRSSSPSACRILGFIGSSSQNRCLGFSEDVTNGFKIKIFNWGNDTTTSVTTSGKWEHIVLTKDGSTTKLYINGVQSWSGSYTLSLSGGYIGVGCIYGAGTSVIQAWHGGLSKWILENKARTATEIQNYFNDTAWQYGLAPKPTIWHGSSPIKEMGYGNTGKYAKYLKRTLTGYRSLFSSEEYTVQMSEFYLSSSSGNLSRPSGTTITSNYAGISGEGIEKLIDGTTSTKYCTRTGTSTPTINIQINLGDYVDLSKYNQYKRYTANDNSNRDPISRTLSTSMDGINRTTVSTVSNASITTSRNALAGTWNISAPNTSTPIKAVYYGSTKIRPCFMETFK